MAENKKSFVLYADLIHTVRKMPKDKAGELFVTILSYVNDENPIVEDMLVDVVFEPIKRQMKRDLEKYECARGKQSESGAMGNLKRWNKDLYEAVLKKETPLSVALNIAKNRKESVPDEMVSGEETLLLQNDIAETNSSTEIEEKPTITKRTTKEEKIQQRMERQIQFGKSLEPFKSEYSREMLNEFYNYWREPTPSGVKMRWELEKTWSLKLRLNTWQSKDDKWGKAGKTKPENELSDAAQKLKELISNTQS